MLRRIFYDAPDPIGAGTATGNENPDIVNGIPGAPPAPDPNAPPQPPPPASPEAPPPASGGNGNEPTSNYSVPGYWEELEQRLSTTENTFEIPEHIKTGKIEDREITRAESFNELVKVIQENTKIPELDDPVIRDYVANKRSEEFDFKKWVSGYVENDRTKLNDREFMFKAFKDENGKSESRPDGWTDEDIEQELDRMGRIEMTKERRKLESAQEQMNIQRISELEKQNIERQRQYLENQKKQEEIAINNLESYFRKNTDINGIKLGESELNNAFEEFRVLNSIDESGRKPLLDLFSDNKNLFKAFVFLRNDGALIKDIIGGIKSEAAKNILERTSLTPSTPNNVQGGAMRLPTAEDFLE